MILTDIRAGMYRHYKGNEYMVLCVARHSETQEDMVIYMALNSSDIWCRPADVFNEIVMQGETLVVRFQYLGGETNGQ